MVYVRCASFSVDSTLNKAVFYRYAPKSVVFDTQFLHPGQGDSSISVYTQPAVNGDVVPADNPHFDYTKLQWERIVAPVLSTQNKAVCAKAPTGSDPWASATGTKYMKSSLYLNHPKLAVKFEMQLPSLPMFGKDDSLATGFSIFSYGVPQTVGAVEIRYQPRIGDVEHPHELVAIVWNGTSTALTCTATPQHTGIFVPVYLEWNGQELVFFCDTTSDVGTVDASLPNLMVSNQLLELRFGADYHVPMSAISGLPEDQVLVFNNLSIYNHTTIIDDVDLGGMPFPYFNWDSQDSGVVAVLPTPTIPEDYYTFVDLGYEPSYVPATFQLGSLTGAISDPTIYINEKAYPVGSDATTVGKWANDLALLGSMSFPHDGQMETLTFTVSGTTLTICSENGLNSYAVRIEGASQGDFGKTKPIIGKIPQQFQLPITGEPNEGVSILGASVQVGTPKGLSLVSRDDQVCTQGAVIGNLSNRPASNPFIVRLKPKNFFGSDRAPFPANAIIVGEPNKLSTTRGDYDVCAYGVMWERYLGDLAASNNHVMSRAPRDRARQGDAFGGFSFDIPAGVSLRGVAINFCSMLPGYEGNAAGYRWDWGIGHCQFPFTLQGNSDYVILYTPMIAVDEQGLQWRTIPSIGTDAAKVSGVNIWRELSFKKVDYDTLVDDQGRPLLRGARRVHFKLVLATEPTACVFNALSYTVDKEAKK